MTAQKSPWAVLAYLVADGDDKNQLDRAVDMEVRHLITAARDRRVPIAIQADFLKQNRILRVSTRPPVAGTTWDTTWLGPDRQEWLEELRRKNMRLEKFARIEEADSADFRTLGQFLMWAHSEFDAHQNALIFWGHGFGPAGLFIEKNATGQPHTMLLPALEQALAAFGKALDLLIFRACFASTIEMAYELRARARFAVASQSLVPVHHPWPYSTIFSEMTGRKPVEEVAAHTARAISIHNHVPENLAGLADVPIALLDLARVPALRTPLTNLSAAMVAAGDQPVLSDGRTARDILHASAPGSPASKEHPGDPAIVDVLTLCRALAAAGGGLGAAAEQVRAAISQVVRYPVRSTTRGGIGLFAKAKEPPSLFDNVQGLYGRLAVTETGWGDVALHVRPGDAAADGSETA